MTMHPALVRAIVLAALAKVPDGTKRRSVSKVPERRESSEEVIAASIFGGIGAGAIACSLPVGWVSGV
ncbi:hypothetical protein F7D01_06155 [Erythrobacter sp. 3-20A1M]|uniref:hypothetical protein n=1 Tax=Erythrobacter sp. 3-20A1M TaxID=2653850 RepID=UPI001BFC6960|nr:hypothetical protein [Erythrobacter sp. 3-20A1M]QWC56731.1 hypothetical protein F7D01_06155 [Erythrobacter sp. 3-20A1M]